MAIASGGWIWGGVTGAFFGYDFATRAVPSLNEVSLKSMKHLPLLPEAVQKGGNRADGDLQYCELRYADLWHDYQKKTPYVLVPYVY